MNLFKTHSRTCLKRIRKLTMLVQKRKKPKLKHQIKLTTRHTKSKPKIRKRIKSKMKKIKVKRTIRVKFQKLSRLWNFSHGLMKTKCSNYISIVDERKKYWWRRCWLGSLKNQVLSHSRLSILRWL